MATPYLRLCSPNKKSWLRLCLCGVRYTHTFLEGLFPSCSFSVVVETSLASVSHGTWRAWRTAGLGASSWWTNTRASSRIGFFWWFLQCHISLPERLVLLLVVSRLLWWTNGPAWTNGTPSSMIIMISCCL
ncbi:uncharacterized protein LOC114265863 [Camellia sinensis]|uniref:uncharacterized protein LOC114265863 n=1 Tax=Camellia sinensis TaxID=4442 RepID=UPI00103619A2|nr:uncharacterized protein LOC114265863 [Camellia sinensis]